MKIAADYSTWVRNGLTPEVRGRIREAPLPDIPLAAYAEGDMRADWGLR